MAQKGEDIVITMSIRHDKNLLIVVTCPLKRSLYLVLINQGNNVDVQHALEKTLSFNCRLDQNF